MPDTQPQTQKKVLIVEDESALGRALKLKLEHEGFVAEIASDGQAALELITSGGFDIVLMDLVMPKMDGFSALEELRKRQNSTPVIVLSNLSQESDRARALELGAKEMFIKSDVPISKVVEYVKQTLAG